MTVFHVLNDVYVYIIDKLFSFKGFTMDKWSLIPHLRSDSSAYEVAILPFPLPPTACSIIIVLLQLGPRIYGIILFGPKGDSEPSCPEHQ
jgi:hypothetical protein